LNQFACHALAAMPQTKEPLTGPMNVQPLAHGLDTLMQPQATTPATETKPKKLARKQSARADAVRIAKAKISRRSSLRKQRQALKD
jgi:hypothetical protein